LWARHAQTLGQRADARHARRRSIKCSGSSASPRHTREWSILADDWATRYLAEKDDGPDCRVVAAVSRQELLNRLEEIVAVR
jgi:hypothetical protein